MAVKKTFEFFFSPLLKKFFQDMGRDPNNLEMILLRQKAGQLLKDSNKVIQFPQKESFMKQVEAMKRSGDIVDPNNLKKNDNVLTREMFQDSNLNKVALDRDRAIKAKARIEEKKEETIMDRINNAMNRIDEIKKEQADMYRPKTDAEIKAKFDKQNKDSVQRFKDKMKKDEPEDKADGGRIGFRAGKFVFDKVVAKFLKNQKKLQEAVDDIFPTGDYKYDAEMAADAFVENNPQIFKNLLREDLPDEVSSEIYGAVLRPITNNMAKMRELRKATRPEKTLQSMKENKTIDMSDPEIADEFTRFMKETDPEGFKKLEQTVELSNFDPKGRKKNAKGGRIGYQEGGGIESRLEQLGGDVTSAEQLLQQINERIQSAESNLGEGAGSGIGSLPRQMPIGQPPNMSPLENAMRSQQPLGQPGLASIANYTPFGGETFNQVPEQFRTGFDEYKKENPIGIGGQAISYSMLPDGNRVSFGDTASASGFSNFLNSIGQGVSPVGQATAIQSPLQQQQNLQKALPGLFAKGGRAGFYTGGIADVEPSLDDIGHGSDSLMSRTRLMSPGSQTTTSTGLNYLLAEDNDNLRVPFKVGGDAGRRAFLKLLATLTGGAAAFKTGLLGLGEGAGKKAVTETVKQSAGSGTPPPYFFKLVEKIKTMGDDVTPKYATKDREVVKQYKDFELTEDIATGEQTIQRKKPSDFEYYDEQLYEDVYMNYKPGKGQADEGAPKVADEYVEDTSYIRTSGSQKGDIYDTVDGVPDDVIQEGTMFEDTMTEFGKTKKADGGRIGFDGGGSPLQRLRQEIVDSMKGYAPADVTEDQLQLVVKDITLDMTAEQAQASALSNFRKLFGMAKGGLAGMLGE